MRVNEFNANKDYILGLYILMAGICFQLGLILDNHSEYVPLFSQLFILASFFVFCYQSFVIFSQELKNLHGISRNLEKKMHQLSKLQAEVQKAAQEKENFLATMSHEIRTPVNGIVGNVALFELTSTSSEQKKLLSMITISANNLITLIDDILDLPNILSKHVKLNYEKFSLVDLLESVIDVVTPKSFEKEIALNYFVELSAPSEVIGDSKRLGQILLNLLNNALKFTDKGEVFVGVTQAKQLSNTVEILFEVKDTGSGIPQNKLKDIFSPFTQADKSISRKYGGTGLGLSISTQLVELMEGKIWVESVLGEGSRFMFTVKLLLPENNSNNLNIFDPIPGINCLVVSENKTLRGIIDKRFKQWKIKSKIVSTFPEAMHFVGNQSESTVHGIFNLMLVDVGHEQKNATHFLKANAIDPLGSLYSIALINLGDNRILNLDKFTNEKITKPLKTKVLYNALKNFHDKFLLSPVVTSGLSTKEALDYKNPVIIEDKLSNSECVQPKLKILVVEDNIVNQKLILSVLKKLGHDPYLVENGQKAVNEVEINKYDLILMDLQMPIMDGLDATKLIRKNTKEKFSPKIIALTANIMTDERERCLSAGMDDYLSKPLQIKELSNMIKKWFPNI